jgi:hypothetical protein
MDEFEDDDDDAAINAPLDVRYVIVGLAMMVLGLIILAFTEYRWLKSVGAFVYFASFFVMLKKQKENPL